MASFEIEGPDGKRYTVEAPDMDTALSAFKRFSQNGATPEKSEPPEGYFIDPRTGAMTSRELLTNAIEPSAGQSARIGATAGATLGGDDELAAGARYALPPGDYTREEQANLERELWRARKDAAWRDHPVATASGAIGGAIAGAVGTRGVLQRAGVGIAAAPTVVGRAGQMAAGGVIGGGVEGFLSGEGDYTNRAKNAAFGAAAGGVLAPLAGFGVAKIVNTAEKVGGKALASIFRRGTYFDHKTGKVTEAGVKALRTLGYNVDEITDTMRAELARSADDAVSGRIPANAVEGTADFKRFDVPFTKGQATGDVAQIAAEENFRAGTRGQGAYNAITEFDGMQRAAVRNARDGIIPGQPGTTATDAADDVISAVRREAESARQAGSRAYDALERSGAAISPRSGEVVRREIGMALQADNIAVDAGTPNAQRALNVIEGAISGDNGGSVPFNAIERTRQRLLSFQRASMSGANGGDQEAMRTIVQRFDDWVDDSITSALISGDETVLADAKQARQLWAKYRSTFLGKKGADNFIRKIVEDDLSPDQVSSWLFGASSNIGGGQSSLTAKRVRDIVGADSPEWANVRRAAWDRVTTGADGEMFGPDRIVSNIDKLLNGKGQELSGVLYSPEELAQIKEFRNMVARLRVPRKAANPSGTSYDIQRAINGGISRLAGVLGGLPGIAASQAVEQSGKFSSTVAARAAVRGVTINPPTAPLDAAAAAAAMSGAAQETVLPRR